MGKRLGVLGVVFYLVILFWQQWPDEKLRVVFCDVGQGDGAVVTLGSFQALVDTGASGNKIKECLSANIPFWDRELEIVFLSHGDRDHAGALEEVKQSYRVGRIIDYPKSGDIVRYGDLSFEIYKGSDLVMGMKTDESNSSNQSSVVMQLNYGEFSVLFTGDIDKDTELAVVGLGVLENVDVLKVAHHGSKYSSTSEFLELVKPKISIISSGAKNNYGHPSGDTLSRLDMVGTKIFRTDQVGTIIVKTDGRQLDISSTH